MHFYTFQFFGLWYNDWRSYRFIKLVHRSLIVLLIVHLSLFQMFALFSVKRSIDEYINTIFLSMTYFVHIHKTLVFMLQNRRINEMLDKFRLDMCRTRGPEEKRILSEHLYKANWTYSARMIITLFCGLMIIGIPIFVGFSTGKFELLPFDTYFFNINDLAQWTLAYILQSLTIITVIVTDVCLDSTPCACMILACAQLEICRHRIKYDSMISWNEITPNGVNSKGYKEEMALKQYVKHFVLIREIVHKLQSAFISIVVPIFGSALLTLCTSTFQLAQVSLFLFTCLYTCFCTKLFVCIMFCIIFNTI